MGKTYVHHKDAKVKCPFYAGFSGCDLRCEGPERGVKLIKRYRRVSDRDRWMRVCAGDWEKCPIAQMLTEIYRGG